ncbi:hypothetical protein O987_22270 [Comamonas testosteroni TK102]|uniref:Uncharacterized protein n=1 Tax=Comamonas testosteroni TK102 TaxID=1392005 RepID=A0A076PXN2_COMTE|nr:hypothetical protein O987_22270 [Comamonas testosteroni TK102]
MVLGPGSVGRGADEMVKLSGENDAMALMQVVGESFEVVLDFVRGAPMIATLKAARVPLLSARGDMKSRSISPTCHSAHSVAWGRDVTCPPIVRSTGAGSCGWGRSIGLSGMRKSGVNPGLRLYLGNWNGLYMYII